MDAVKISELSSLDSSFVLRHPDHFHQDVSGISAFGNWQKQSLVFVKDLKFFRRLENHFKEVIPIEIVSTMTLVFEEKFYIENLLEEKIEWSNIKNSFAAIATVKSVSNSMVLFSKPFYDQKYKDLNDFVDGRQMGTAQVHPSALIAQNVFIGEDVVIGRDVKIYSGCVIMSKSQIMDNSVIYPGVTIYPYVVVGKNCRIHAGSRIGADGFGYVFLNGIHQKIWHFGSVVIGDDVEIGANTTIDSGTFSPTIIGRGTKIDNQVQLGHNDQIGQGVIICGQVGIAGSTSIGDYSVIGGKAAIGNDLKIGRQCQIGGHSGVNCDWPDKSIISGYPARPLKEWLRCTAYLRKVALKNDEKI